MFATPLKGNSLIFLLMLLSAAAGSAIPVAGADLLVGWASVNITPEQPVALAGQMYTRVSKAVHDPVTATILVLETKTPGRPAEQAVMVSCDLAVIDKRLMVVLRERLKRTLPDFD